MFKETFRLGFLVSKNLMDWLHLIFASRKGTCTIINKKLIISPSRGMPVSINNYINVYFLTSCHRILAMHALDKFNFRKLSRKQFAMCIAREALKHSCHTAYYSRLLTANTRDYLVYRAYLSLPTLPPVSCAFSRLTSGIRSSNEITGNGLTRYT